MKKVKMRGINSVHRLCCETLRDGKQQVVQVYYNKRTCSVTGVVATPDIPPIQAELNNGNLYCGYMEKATKPWTIRSRVQKRLLSESGVKYEY